MKNLLAVLTLVIIFICASSTAMATTVTLQFDPNDILDLYPAAAGTSDVPGQNKATQPDARRVHAVWGNPFYETFYNPTAPHPQPTDYNTYMSWRNSLNDAGEGIAVFNSWFLNAGAAKTWGETVVNKPGTAVTATAAGGWNYRIIEDPYGLGGSAVQWWTLDPSKRLRPTDLGGLDMGPFSITADLYYDIGPSGWDVGDQGVLLGDEIRFWVGNLNGDDPEFYRDDTEALYFGADDSPFAAKYSTGSGDLGSGFEAAMSAVATPEPATMFLVVSGLVGLVGFRRRFKK